MQLSPEAAFTAFVAESGPRLRRTARLLCGDEHRAEELVQQTLVKTYLAWPRAQATDPEAYARRVLANQRIDTWRKHRREVLTDPAEVPDAAVPPRDDYAADRDEVVRALLTLTARQRRIVVLRHLVGLTDAEVAADLGVSVGTVKSTASRGLAQLRHVLAPQRAGAGAGVTPRLRAAVEPEGAVHPGQAAAAIGRANVVRRRRRAVAAGAVAVVAVLGVALGASVLPGALGPTGGGVAADWPVYDSLESLAEASDVVVEGTVLDARLEEIDIDLGPREDLESFEVYRVDVAAAYVGAVRPGDVIEVAAWLPRGESPDADVRLVPGTAYVLFLGEAFESRPRHMLNPFQAVYRVADDGRLVPVSNDEQSALQITRAELEALTP